MKNKKGFTLVELLAVVVIMGIVIGISIPAVTAVQKRLVKQRVNTFYRVVEESADAYVEQYHADFDGLSDCFEIPYDNLIKEDLLKETDITCLSEAFGEVQGKVIATKVNGENTYKYTYYLTCYDKETNKLLAKSDRIPEGCLGVNGGYSIDVKPVHVQDSLAYDGNWISGSVRYDIEGYSPYFYPINTFQYKKEFAIEWHSENTTITDSNGKGYILFSTNNNTNPDESSLNMRVKFRGVDTGNNISTDNGWYDLKIDNTVPVVVISGENTEGWVNSTILTLTTSKTIPSGVKNYYIDINNDGVSDYTVPSIDGNYATYSLVDNLDGTIKVRAESNTGIMGGWTTSKQIRLDLIAPTCTIDKTETYKSAGVSLTVVCSDEGGSTCENQTHTKVKNDTTYTVTDGAGNTGTCNATIERKKYTRNRTRTCTTYSRCSAAGCETYNSCRHSSCGCATYKLCTTTQCGTVTGCNDDSNGHACSQLPINYVWYDNLSGCSIKEARCNYQGCYGWGDCPRTCRHSTCGCETYNSCRNSSCTCQTYKRSSSCGCETYSGWSGWSSWSTATCSEDSYKECESEYRYY